MFPMKGIRAFPDPHNCGVYIFFLYYVVAAFCRWAFFSSCNFALLDAEYCLWGEEGPLGGEGGEGGG